MLKKLKNSQNSVFFYLPICTVLIKKQKKQGKTRKENYYFFTYWIYLAFRVFKIKQFVDIPSGLYKTNGECVVCSQQRPRNVLPSAAQRQEAHRRGNQNANDSARRQRPTTLQVTNYNFCIIIFQKIKKIKFK